MKSGIHPNYHTVTVHCAGCGNEFVKRGSTIVGAESLRVEICANCHPFFTGKQKLVDTAGTRRIASRRNSQSKSPSEKRSKRLCQLN